MSPGRLLAAARFKRKYYLSAKSANLSKAREEERNRPVEKRRGFTPFYSEYSSPERKRSVG